MPAHRNAVNVTKARLEELFVDELARLQCGRRGRPRSRKKWLARSVPPTVSSTKLNRLDEAVLYERSVNIDTWAKI